ncbi:MAG: hypothetical protein IPJ88_09930 [Myxococcales bacterium]|nr:MAG: hypothetical protein IPJ88_09930 [Myxococcales bacterium]
MMRCLLHLLLWTAVGCGRFGYDPVASELGDTGEIGTPQNLCSDGIQNQDESDIDCGGIQCEPCPSGNTCLVSSDCSTNNCALGVCLDLSCSDGILSQDESDTDCGGSLCNRCANGNGCLLDGDCSSNVCVAKVCQTPSCSDGVQNQDETDIDCGGSLCSSCNSGQNCSTSSDCSSKVCTGNTCQAPSCSDAALNQDETDIDCGGSSCSNCNNGQNCSTSSDCSSKVCTGNTCQAPSCSDTALNQDETDIDCGGSSCASCSDGAGCSIGSDCNSGVCITNICQTSSCSDGVQNQDETDIDCGGSLCGACTTGQSCISGVDCSSSVCTANVCQAPSCSDGTLNQDETDIDCGGSLCSSCINGQSCNTGSDCTSGICDANICSGSNINYFSIGRNSGTLYAIGTASVTAGSNAVSFAAGASLPLNVGRGDRLVLDPGGAGEETIYVLDRQSTTQVTLQSIASSTHSAVSYRFERAFIAINAWESARQGNLVSETRIEVGVMYNDAPFTENVRIDGSTTSASYYMELTSAEVAKHNGFAGSGSILSPATPGHAIQAKDPYLRISWLEITGWSTNSAGSYDAINIGPGGDQILLHHLIVHDDGHGAQSNSDANGIGLENTNSITVTVQNSLVYNIARAGILHDSCLGCSLEVQNTTLYQCVQADDQPTVYGCIGEAWSSGSVSTIYVKNVAALDVGSGAKAFFYNSYSYDSTFEASLGNSNHNISSDNSAPGMTTFHGVSSASTFVDLTPGSEDLHLKSGATAIDNGMDLTPLLIDDIEGESRPSGSAYDIGADEY